MQHQGFPVSSDDKASACNAWDLDSIPGLGRCPGEGNGNPLQYPCLENPMDRGAWWATVHGVVRVGHDLATKPSNHQWLIRTSLVGQTVKCLPTMWETRVLSLGWEDPLEKEMAAHSCTLAWKIPWTEKPGRLQSMGSQRVGHNWAISLSLSMANYVEHLFMCLLTICMYSLEIYLLNTFHFLCYLFIVK